MKHCSRCNLPETYETIEFDQKNVCNVCAGAKYKQTKIDWYARKKLLDQIIEKYIGKFIKAEIDGKKLSNPRYVKYYKEISIVYGENNSINVNIFNNKSYPHNKKHYGQNS